MAAKERAGNGCGGGYVGAVTGGDVDRFAGARGGAEGEAAELAIVVDGRGAGVCEKVVVELTGEVVFGDADGGEVGDDAEVGGDAGGTGMEDTAAVDEEHVGEAVRSAGGVDEREIGGEFAKGEVRGDVGKAHGEGDDAGPERVGGVGSGEDVGGDGVVGVAVGDIDGGDRAGRRVEGGDASAGGDFVLETAETGERADGLKVGEAMGGEIDAGGTGGDTFGVDAMFFGSGGAVNVGAERSVGADDAVAGAVVRVVVVEKVVPDPAGGDAVAEGVGEIAVGGDGSRGNLREEFAEFGGEVGDVGETEIGHGGASRSRMAGGAWKPSC